MNDTERLEAMDSYFNRYRRLKNKLNENEQEQEIARADYQKLRDDLQHRRSAITQDLASMRQIITKMIDEDCDPVMAGLKMNDDEQINSIWQQRDEDNFNMDQDDIMKRVGLPTRLTTADISTLSIGQLNLGASLSLGATSAQGSISMGPNGGYQQVNGHGDYHWTGTAEL